MRKVSERGTQRSRAEEVEKAGKAPKVVKALGLPVRLVKCLEEGTIRTVKELTRRRAGDLLGLKGIGSKSIDDVRRILAVYGLSLRDEEGSSIK